MEHELLKPRYKVIADYPCSCLRVGYVISEPVPMLYQQAYAQAKSELAELNKYPHVFKKLEWWQERDEKDMPQYVRVIKDAFHPKEVPYVAKVNSIINKLPYLVGFMLTDAGDGCYTHWKNLEPITEAEYITHHQTPSNDNTPT